MVLIESAFNQGNPMDSFTLFPEKEIDRAGHISKIFKEFEGVELKTILLAREEGLALLKDNLH
jgi:hypothetical protein